MAKNQKNKPPRKNSRARQEGGAPHPSPQAISPPSQPETSIQVNHAPVSTGPSDKEDAGEKETLCIERKQMQFNGLLVVAAFLALILGWYQWQVTSGQLNQMVLDQRPWLMIGTPTIEKPTIGEFVVGTVELTNTGKTPAKVLEDSIYVGHLAFGHQHPGVGSFSMTSEGPRLILDMNSIRSRLAKGGKTSGINFFVPPGGKFDCALGFPCPSDETQFKDLIGEGAPGQTVMVLRYKYTDVGDTAEHTTISTFIYNAKAGTFHKWPQYNFME